MDNIVCDFLPRERQTSILFLEMLLLPKYLEGSSSWSQYNPLLVLLELSIIQQQRLQRHGYAARYYHWHR